MIDNHESLQHIYTPTTSTEFHQCISPFINQILLNFFCLKQKQGVGAKMTTGKWQMMWHAKFDSANQVLAPAQQEQRWRWQLDGTIEYILHLPRITLFGRKKCGNVCKHWNTSRSNLRLWPVHKDLDLVPTAFHRSIQLCLLESVLQSSLVE